MQVARQNTTPGLVKCSIIRRNRRESPLLCFILRFSDFIAPEKRFCPSFVDVITLEFLPFRELEISCNKERDNLNQCKMKLEKTKEELNLHKTRIVEKDKHLDGITAEVKNYNQHVSEIVEELDKVIILFFSLYFTIN